MQKLSALMSVQNPGQEKETAESWASQTRLSRWDSELQTHWGILLQNNNMDSRGRYQYLPLLSIYTGMNVRPFPNTLLHTCNRHRYFFSLSFPHPPLTFSLKRLSFFKDKISCNDFLNSVYGDGLCKWVHCAQRSYDDVRSLVVKSYMCLWSAWMGAQNLTLVLWKTVLTLNLWAIALALAKI